MKSFLRAGSLLFIITLLGFFSFVSVNIVSAAAPPDRIASVSGDWNDTDTWGGQSVPTSLQTVSIASGVTVNITEDAEALTVSIAEPSAVTILNISDDVTLTTGYVYIDSNDFSATLNVGNGHLVVNNGMSGALYIEDNSNAYVTVNSGTITVTNSIVFNLSGGNLVSTGSSTITLGENLEIGGTLTTSGTGTINFNGASAQTIPDYSTYNNLIFSGGGTKSFSANTTINGNLTIESGTIANLVLTSPTTTTLYFDEAYQPAGTYGPVGSGADFENDTYFAGSGGLLTVLELGEGEDITPPDTFITLSDTDSSVATFEFSSNEEGTFECSLDEDSFVACTSPYVTPLLASGEHSFEVRAIDASLNVDSSPAVETWEVEQDDPVGIWHFDEGEGVAAEDSSENENDGELSGEQYWGNGRVGSGFDFNGSGSYFTIDRPVSRNFSICAWIKTETPGDLDPDHWRLAPIMDSETAHLADDFGFGIDVNGKLAYGNGGAYDETVNGETSIIDNEWHYVCTTRDITDGSVVLYVDGTVDATGTTDTAVLDSNESAFIGYGLDGAVPFGGFIDELSVYNRVLSEGEILNLYESFPSLGNRSSGVLTKRGHELRAAGLITVGVPIPTPAVISPFLRLLKFNMTGEDVKSLQVYLNTHNFLVAPAGVGSPGFETSYFGARTRAAVILFQQAHGLTPDGIVGPMTRAAMIP